MLAMAFFSGENDAPMLEAARQGMLTRINPHRPADTRVGNMLTFRRISAPPHRLDLRVRELAQLFNSLDPSPFLNRDLDRDAEEYIESWALEFPAGSRYHITVHLQQPPAEADAQTL